MVGAEVSATIDWLVDGARSAAEPQDMLDELCRRLVAAGLPLWRVGVIVRTLHPQVMGRRMMWHAGEGVTTAEAPFEFVETAEFRDSPIARVFAERAAIRRRLDL